MEVQVNRDPSEKSFQLGAVTQDRWIAPGHIDDPLDSLEDRIS
jgi:hypothetical protein